MAAPLESFEGGFEAPAAEPVVEISDEQFARQALSTHFGGVEVVDIWARNPFKEYRYGKQIGGAMETVCRVRDGNEIGTRALWSEGDEHILDDRTQSFLGKLANANWSDPRTSKFRRDYAGDPGHYRIIQGGLRD